jgi:hypothetical protein
MPIPPFPDDVNCDLDRRAARDEHGVRPSDLIIGAAVLLPAALKIGKELRDKVTDDSHGADAA